jgi:UTP-glucose-1-phosphate uridylyltransferase
MVEKSLIVLAAGLGSRYGGMKQVDPVGPTGEIIMDYSVYDALRNGFGKVIFIIREETRDIFHESIGAKLKKYIEVEYVFQKDTDLPDNLVVSGERSKPWGTGHAVFAARNTVRSPFAVINADDFYGEDTFRKLSEALDEIENKKGMAAMVGFPIEKTLTENGSVSRGICEIDGEGYLRDVVEKTKIQEVHRQIINRSELGEQEILQPGTIVSMNVWGFVPEFFELLEDEMVKFLTDKQTNLEKDEFYLPFAVNSLVHEGKLRVRVRESEENWFGVTYREDKAHVRESIMLKIDEGVYPKNLWEEIWTKN